MVEQEVKAAIRNKKTAYKTRLQWKIAERRKMYDEAKKEARQVAREAKNDEWIKLDESLQHDFVKNLRMFGGR